MKYEKCPICEEKLRNGVCPMCGYDFNRLGRSRILKDGHWDILTTDKKTSQPKYIHDEKRHPDFKNIKNTKTQSMKTQRKTSTYKNKKEKKRSKKSGSTTNKPSVWAAFFRQERSISCYQSVLSLRHISLIPFSE